MNHTKDSIQSTFGEGTLETGTKLIDTMKEQKKNKCQGVITSTDLTHNSRKAWQTIRKLSNEPTSTNPPCQRKPSRTPDALQWPRNNANKAKAPVSPTVEGIPSWCQHSVEKNTEKA